MEISLNGAKKYSVLINGQTFEIDSPKVKHQRALEESVFRASKSGEPVMGIIIDFLTSTGLPQEVVEDLDAEQLELLVEGLKSKKKN
jgi:hypothetical protein